MSVTILVILWACIYRLPYASAIVCPNYTSFVPLGTYCVKYMGSASLSVGTAASLCATYDSSLPTFLNLAEQTSFSGYVTNVTTSTPWLGYYNYNGTRSSVSSPGIWYDLDGRTCLYLKWGSGEPNGYGSSNCTIMSSYSGVYAVNDQPCSYTFPAICMWRPYPIPFNCITTTTSTTSSTATTTIPVTTSTSSSTSTSLPSVGAQVVTVLFGMAKARVINPYISTAATANSASSLMFYLWKTDSVRADFLHLYCKKTQVIKLDGKSNTNGQSRSQK